MPNKNALTAEWRGLTEKQIKALPSTWEEAYATDCLYFYPGVVCIREHISPKSRSGRSCLMCVEEDRIKKIKNNSSSKKIKNILPTVIMGIKMNILLSDNKE